MNALDELDDIEDDLDEIQPSTLPIEDQFDQMRSFLDGYTEQLHNMEEALDEFHKKVWSPDGVLGLQVEPHEETPLPDLVNSDNKPLSKVLMVISAIQIEIDEYKRMVPTRFYAPLCMFGETPLGVQEEDRVKNGDAQLQLGHMLSLFMDLYNFTSRLNSLCINLVHQLAALYNVNEKLHKSTFKRVHLRQPFAALGDLLMLLACIDECINKNPLLCENGLLEYRRMVRNMKGEPGRYGLTEEKLRTLEVRLQNLDDKLLSGCIFETCIDQEFDVVNMLSVTTNKVFLEEMTDFIQHSIQNLADALESPTETTQRQQLISTSCLFLLHRRLTRSQKPNKKLFSQLWSLCKRCPLVHVHGLVMLQPAAFLLQIMKEKTPLIKVKSGEIEGYAKGYVTGLTNQLPKQVHSLYLQVCTWMVRLESAVGDPNVEKKDILAKRLTLMVNGLLLAQHTSRLLRTCLVGHIEVGLQLQKTTAHLLALCAEMLKAIEIAYFHKLSMAGESVLHMCRQLSFSLQNAFLKAQKKLEQKASSTRHPSDECMDQLAALSLVLRSLNGPPTSTRRIVLGLALAVAQPRQILKEKESEEVKHILWRFSLVAEWQTLLRQSCDTSFLYWVASGTLPTILQFVSQNPSVCPKLPYIMTAFAEGATAARLARHLPDPAALAAAYQRDVEGWLHDYVVHPLSREIETDLRLLIHAAADSVERRNPFKHAVRPNVAFLNLRAFRLFGNMVDVKERVVLYLDTTFYNLTALTPQDWRTYGEMRNMAKEKYGLELTEVYLPGATLEQGLDVLEIMRNIHIFVSRFHYNLNNQIFVEKISENKHVNTINIRHVANSIRTHGMGIINTTVNYTYQFLVQKLFIFSQFLFDDHIKSPCMKSHKFFKDNKEQLNNQYPYDRADNFNRHIRKLGINENGETFLDQFRVLVTEIGNAMGYVRMVRSGGQHYCSNAIKFVPDLQDIADFPDMVSKSGLREESLAAAKNLHAMINGLLDNFAEGTDFFKALVEVFREELGTDKNAHLKYFYIITPPLIINFLEYMVSSKEKLNKRSKEGCFTDDGFAMGLAYLLRVVGQYDKFDSLHWFDTLRDRVVELRSTSASQEEALKAKEARRGRRESRAPDAQSAMNLSAKRIEAFELEVELFYYSFSGARIFFNES